MSDGGFVSFKSLFGKGPASPQQILDEIRTIYFRTTRQTIQNDFAHAIELLKSLPDEETREKATVYMEGLAELRKEFFKEKGKRKRGKGGNRKP